MSKHTNKYWRREKEFISLQMEYDYLYYSLTRINWRIPSNSRVDEINRKFQYKFYNEYSGRWNTSPKHYRKMLNRKQRKKSKQILYQLMNGKDICFEDNYRGCNWYW